MNNSLKNRYLLVLLLLVLGYIFIHTPMIEAQQLTHTVKKGDTLWSICEKYYGDSDLWPKLWQMNPFITNPHLLTTGDVITLFEKEPIKKTIVLKEEKKTVVKETVQPIPGIKGINVSSFTNINTIGYLSREKIIPWGKIFSSDSERLIFSEGDTVYVLLNETRNVQPGDEFIIYKTYTLLKHPFPGNEFGYTVTINGRLVIQKVIGKELPISKVFGEEFDKFGERKAKKNTYKAKIIQVFGTVHADDYFIPYKPVSPCVRPISLSQKVSGNIVAAKDDRQLISRSSIVYIDRGFNQGIERGNLFDVVKTHIVYDPEKKKVWNERKMELPTIKIGVIMILESRPDTAAGLVISAKEDLPVGASIKEISWEENEKPEFLSHLSSCDIE